MPWLLVSIAGLIEIGFALSLKESHGFTRLGPSVLALASGAASFVLLTFAMRSLPAGTAYAVWTGIGAAGTVLVGILVLGDAATPGRLVAITLVITGIVGLRLSGG